MSKFWHILAHIGIVVLSIASQILIPGINPIIAMTVQGTAQAILAAVNHKPDSGSPVPDRLNPLGH